MDSLKELIAPAAERAKSKIIGTFAISWAISNWRFIITLILPDTVNIHNTGLLDFIDKNNILNFCHIVIYPLISTILYIGIYPYLDKFVHRHLEEIRRQKIDEKIKINRMHAVPGNLYWDLKLEVEIEKKKVAEFEINKSRTLATLAEKENQIQSMETEIINQRKSLEHLQHRMDFDFLVGRWELTYSFDENRTGKEELKITEDGQYLIKNNNEWLHSFDIKMLDIDIDRRTIQFIKWLPAERFKKKNALERDCRNKLQIIDKNNLEGNENDTILVSYKRIEFDLGTSV